jgi:hypothetical protein
MKTSSLLSVIALAPFAAFAQPIIQQSGTSEFQIVKITKDLIPTPQFAHSGGAQNRPVELRLIARIVQSDDSPDVRLTR